MTLHWELGESVSGLHAYCKASRITEADLRSLNDFSFQLENRLVKLVESLEHKLHSGDWIHNLIIKESHIAHG